MAGDKSDRFDTVDWDEVADERRLSLSINSKLTILTVLPIVILGLYDWQFVSDRDVLSEELGPLTTALEAEVIWGLPGLSFDPSGVDYLFVMTLLLFAFHVVLPLWQNKRMTKYYWAEFKGNRPAVASLGWLGIVFAGGLLGPLVYPEPENNFSIDHQPPVGMEIPNTYPSECAGEVEGREVREIDDTGDGDGDGGLGAGGDDGGLGAGGDDGGLGGDDGGVGGDDGGVGGGVGGDDGGVGGDDDGGLGAGDDGGLGGVGDGGDEGVTEEVVDAGMCQGTLEYPLGTTPSGEDVLGYIIHGMTISMQIAFIVTFIVIIIGVTFGTVSAYAGGWVDEIMMRFTDIVLSFPTLIMFLLIVYIYGASLGLFILIFAAFGWGATARYVRSKALSVSEEEFIKATKISGAGTRRVVTRHVVPNTASSIITQLTLIVPSFLLAEAQLSFLGLGADIDSWGQLIAAGRGSLEFAPWIIVAPGVVLFLTILAFNFVGDALLDALNPEAQAEADRAETNDE